MSIKDIIKEGPFVTFLYYKDKALWYMTAKGFKFPVPINDTGDAYFKSEEKSLMMMRWIRKHLDYLESARNE